MNLLAKIQPDAKKMASPSETRDMSVDKPCTDTTLERYKLVERMMKFSSLVRDMYPCPKEVRNFNGVDDNEEDDLVEVKRYLDEIAASREADQGVTSGSLTKNAFKPFPSTSKMEPPNLSSSGSVHEASSDLLQAQEADASQTQTAEDPAENTQRPPAKRHFSTKHTSWDPELPDAKKPRPGPEKDNNKSLYFRRALLAPRADDPSLPVGIELQHPHNGCHVLSVLDCEEQKTYVSLMEKYQYVTRDEVLKMKGKDREGWKSFFPIHQKVLLEQEKCMEELTRFAKEHRLNKDFIPQGMKEYVADCLQARLHRCLIYPRFYTLQDTIHLMQLGPYSFQVCPYFTLQSTLAELGRAPKLMVPKEQRNVCLPKPPTVSRRFPPVCDSANPHQLPYLSKVPVSQDENIQKLLPEAQPDFVMSRSVFKALVLMSGASCIRQIPITISEVDLNGKKHKVVYLDRPLPKIFTSNYEQKEIYSKLALRTLTTQPLPSKKNFRPAFLDQNSSRKDIDSIRQLPDSTDDTFDTGAHDAEELETFGVAYQPMARHTGRNPKEENLKEDGKGEEREEQKTKYQEGQVPESRNLKLPLLDHVTYNTWELRLNQVPFRILIRSFVHAARPNQGMGGTLIPYHMFVKPEYQSHYGVEVLSWEEAAREWAACAITPNSRVLRVRMNSYNNKVIMVEDLSPDMVQVSSQKVGFKPNEALANIHLVLSRLKNQLPGHYLLDIKRGERNVNLKVAVDASKTGIENLNRYDLHTAYSKVPQQGPKREEEYLPIDRSLLPPFNRVYGRIPCTFWPLKPGMNRKGGKPMTGKKKKKNKGQNKKKAQKNAP
ncbi:unnamed protein product [Darwinula stevensoni]|uniref:Little elongation complex subunit 2 C-terminal domain-containing protein n=1 Tax=Darwinula stevensoni TaxID=69355 RepID=A0A7R8XB78_9CRUS|nr:unnamed protein product [Darwinula stevensoni]CAG0886197.1 unnamed protein product [Darwinula stevensoni]